MLKPKEVQRILGVTFMTLCRWDKSGKLVAHRNAANRRYYTQEQIDVIRGIPIYKVERKTILYTRVSNPQQKDDLKNQKQYLFDYFTSKNYSNVEYIEDIGSGLNYNRKKWNKLLDRVSNNEIDRIIVAHKDRFIRFGFEWFERYCNKFNCVIEIINNEKLSPIEEITQDLISIIHVFSSRIYGLRTYKKRLEQNEDL